MEVGCPRRRVGNCCWVGGKVQAGVQVSREPSKGISLLPDAGLHEVAGTLAQLEVFTPEPVEPARGLVAEAHHAAPGAMCSLERDFSASWESALCQVSILASACFARKARFSGTAAMRVCSLV